MVRLSYACVTGAPATIAYDPHAATATVQIGQNAPVVLKQVPSGSGFSYQAPGYILRGQGGEIAWSAGGKAPLRCRAEMPTSVAVETSITAR